MQGRGFWRVTGTLATVVVMLFAAGQTWAMVAQQQSVSERTYRVGVSRVQLDAGIAAVRIRPGRDGQVVVKQYLDWTVRKPTVRTVFEDDTLTVQVRCNQVVPIADVGCGAQIDLEVPAAAGVTGGSTSGSLDVRGLSGEVRVSSGSGAIQLAGLSGPVYARATSGAVDAKGLTSARFEVDTTSGAVDVAFARPPHAVSVGVSSGSVTLALPEGSRYAFSGEGGSGNRHLDPVLADASSPDTVRITAGSGSVSVVPAHG
ncbi:DUF4097 domain-containing protein [Kitasatospora sp. NBC_01560]|uniref:DUF4097 family beta strand repeat-containing protein n=1 Tax=Kitasatospora sp. NBC_01560 TaxID=2975965 RepID=UPI00386A804E